MKSKNEWNDQIKFKLAMWYMQLVTGLLIFRVYGDLQMSSKPAKSCKIHKHTQNTAKLPRNRTKYMSVQNI